MSTNITAVILSIFATRPIGEGIRHFSISLMVKTNFGPAIYSLNQDSSSEQREAFLRAMQPLLAESFPAHQHLWSTWDWFLRHYWQSGVVQYRFEAGQGSWPNIEGFDGLEDQLIRDYLGE
jgi:hypothetical protein